VRILLCATAAMCVSCASAFRSSPAGGNNNALAAQPTSGSHADSPSPEDIASLTVLVDSDDIRVKMEAASVLARLGTQQALSVLQRAFDRATTGRFRAHVLDVAAEANLYAFSGRALRAVTDSEQQVRAAGCRALLSLRGNDAEEDLLRILRYTEDAGVARTIILALGDSGVKAAVPVLADLLHVQDAEVRALALDVLVRLTGKEFGADAFQWKQWWAANAGAPRVRWLEQANAELRRTLADSRRRHEEYIIGLLSSLPEENRPGALADALMAGLPTVAAHALNELAAMQSASGLSEETTAAAVTGSLEILGGSEPPELRAAAAGLLGLLGSAAAAEPLEAALEDAEPSVAVAAANALGTLGLPTAVPNLTNLLEHSEVPEVLSAAALALGRLKASGSTEAILVLTRHDQSSVRESAARALGALRAAAAVGPLTDLVAGDPEPKVRWFAADALGQINDKRALPVLSEALTDPNVGVRQAAARALGLIGDPASVDPLTDGLTDADARVADACWEALLKVIGEDTRRLCRTAQRALEIGMVKRAAEAYDRLGSAAVDIPPDDAMRRAEVYERLENWSSAALALESLLSARPEDAEVTGRYLAALIGAGQWDKAGDAAGAAGESFPDYEPRWWESKLAIAQGLTDSAQWEKVTQYINSLKHEDRQPPDEIAEAFSQLAEKALEAGVVGAGPVEGEEAP